MHPPGKEKPTGKGGLLKTDDTANLQQHSTEGKPAPANVTLLSSRGVKFTHRPASRDVKLSCPLCGAILVIDEAEPFWLCTGDFLCATNRKPFREVVALVEKVGKP